MSSDVWWYKREKPELSLPLIEFPGRYNYRSKSEPTLKYSLPPAPTRRASAGGPRRAVDQKFKRKAVSVLTKTLLKKRNISRKGSAMPGYYAKRFRTRRIPRPLKVRVHGYEQKTEQGGLVTESEYSTGVYNGVEYVGHGCAINQMHRAFWGSIVRAVFRRVGHDLSSWGALVQGAEDNAITAGVSNQFRVYYKKENETADAVVAVTLDTTTTYLDVVQGLTSQFETVLSAATQPKNIYLTTALIRYDGEFGPTGKVNLRNARCMLHMTSKLSIQNRTSAGGSADLEVNNTNPLEGVVYEGFGNGFQLGFTNNPQTGQEVIASAEIGVYSFEPYVGGDAMDKVYWRPPFNRNAFIGTKRIGRTRLQPGQIRRGFVSYTKMMTLQQWLNSFKNSFIPGSSYFPHGKTQLYGFEKYCRNSASNPIVLAYEVEQRYTSRLYLQPTETQCETTIFTASG